MAVAPISEPAAATAGVHRDAAWRLFAALALVGALTILPEVRSANDASRMALTQALVEHQTFAIDASPFAVWPDKVAIAGHFYSDKPALPSLVAVPVYAVLHAFGLTLGFGVNHAYYLIVLLCSRLPWLAASVAFYRSLLLLDAPAPRARWLTVALACGSLFLPYTAVFSNHGLAASGVSLGAYAYLRAGRAPRPGRWLAASGLALGLAAASDMPVGVYAAAGALLIATRPELRRGLPAFVAAAALALAPGVAINVAISGSVVPVNTRPELFAWPGSPWTPDQLTGSAHYAGAELVRYAAAALVGPRGFLLYNPLLVPALAALAGALVRGRRRREAWAVAASTAVLWGYYLANSTNLSGYAYSIRWFTPSLPLLFLALVAAPWRRRWWRLTFGVLLAAGVAVALVGCLNPWSNLSIAQVPLVANLVERWPDAFASWPR